jgi:hypothetical protein
MQQNLARLKERITEQRHRESYFPSALGVVVIEDRAASHGSHSSDSGSGGPALACTSMSQSLQTCVS